MADTIRQQIMNAVKTRLQAITVINGYNFDLGNKVFEWKDSPFADNEMPGLIYKDVSCDISQVEGHRCNLHIEIEIAARAGSIALDIRKMIADIYKAIKVDIQWGLLAMDTLPEGDSMMIDEGGKLIGGVSIKFIILYRTKEWDPYQKL